MKTRSTWSHVGVRALRVALFALPALWAGMLCSAAEVTNVDVSSGAAQPSFAALVDDYLDRFAAFHPSIAAGNGIHDHDGELENFSAARIAAELRWLDSQHAKFAAIDGRALTPDERVDRRILLGIIDGWVLDLRTVRTWTRNPMIYVAAISDGLHNLITMDFAPAGERMRFATQKLAALPDLLSAARSNVQQPPKVFVERAIIMLGGTIELLEHDLPLAFPVSSDTARRDQLLRAAGVARTQLAAFQQELQNDVLPRASGSFAIGTRNVEARYRAEELIDLPAPQLLAIGARELAAYEAEFKSTAARVDAHRDTLQVWNDVQANHPQAGGVVAAARDLMNELFSFIQVRHLMSLPGPARPIVAPAPAYDLGLASMHTSPPLEPHPVQSYYYITDVSPDWSPARQQGWLRMFNYATLADITAHEVAPGHYVHSLYMRRTSGKIRRIWVGLNPFPQPSSGQDGWAHYAEQMVSDEGFRADDPRYRLAMLSESLTRVCRLIAGLRLHSGEWTIDQASAFFEQAAHLPAVAAHQEAVRGTYDPTYGGYFLGKLAALKLRRDYQAARGADYRLSDFHERVMTDGIAPWWAHRQLLLPGSTGTVLE
jgi:uncharacterized protein (DUF885 family)